MQWAYQIRFRLSLKMWTTSIIFLHPDTLSSQIQNISLPSPKILPLSIINNTTSQQNKTNVSTDTLYVDNSVTDLDTTHAMFQ